MNEKERPFLMNRPATNLGLTVANLSLMKREFCRSSLDLAAALNYEYR